MSNRYTLDNLVKALEKPQLLYREAAYLASKLRFLLENGWEARNEIDVVSADWDNLIILDACRYDVFSRRHEFQGTLRQVTSRGSSSWKFLRDNFQGRELHDTVYVTANPFAEKLPSETFHDSKNLLEGAWDAELGTVPPDAVVSAAKKAHGEKPNKKLIIHFMQPHRPWMGPTAEEIREQVDTSGYNRLEKLKERGEDFVDDWTLMKNAGISETMMTKAYEESLDIVLEDVEELINDISGKTVVTADHGELLGERAPLIKKRYGHPGFLYSTHLRTVPWMEIRCEERRTLTSEDPISGESVDSDLLANRLGALGYK